MTYLFRHPLVSALLLSSLILCGCNNNPQEKAATYLQRGNELFDQGEYEKARVEYKNAARIKPTDAELRYRLGMVDDAEGNLRAAFLDFTHAEEQNAHFHPALLKLAEYYMAADQFDQAQKRIDAVLADTPDDADAHGLRAAMFLRQKDFAAAEKEVHVALDKDPANVIGFSVLTGIYKAEGDKDKALQTVEDGIARNPKTLSLLLLEASLYEQAGNLSKTVETYQAIFKLRPNEQRYRIELVRLYLKAKKIDDAETTFRDALAAFPDDSNLKKQFVVFLADTRGVDAAEKEIRGYMQADPQNQDLPFWLAKLYLTHNETDKAVALLGQLASPDKFDKQGLTARALLARIDLAKGDTAEAGNLTAAVLDKDSSNVEALYVRAALAFQQGQYQNAVLDLRTVIRDDPSAKEAFPLLAESLLKQGHLDLAIETLNQLVDTDPLNTGARIRLAQMYHINGDSKHALELLDGVVKAEPAYAAAWESIARVAIDTKDWPRAETAIGKLDAINGQHMTAAFLRGQMLAANGKPDEAVKQYVQVINADPASSLAENALAALVEADGKLNRLDDATRFIEGLKSDNPVVTTVLGECYLAQNKKDQAAATFDKAIAMNSPRPATYLERAKLYFAEGQTAPALDVLAKGVAAAPNDSRLPLMQAEILGSLGRYQEAIALYDNVLASNPGLDAVANNLAEIIADYQYNDPAALEKARKTAERFVGSSNPLLLDTLAWVYYRQGDVQQAQTVMERALAQSGKLPPQVHYHYGAILMKSGKPEQAKAELQQAVVDGANYPGVEDAKRLLEQ